MFSQSLKSGLGAHEGVGRKKNETRQGQTGGSNAFVIFGVFNLFA